ncbi:hypothetical protein, partial [Jannaschia aquimarina]
MKDAANRAAPAADALPVFVTPIGESTLTVSSDGLNLDLLGLRVMAMPPGLVQISLTDLKPMLNVSTCAGPSGVHRYGSVNGVPIAAPATTERQFILNASVDALEFDATNYDWECLIEIDEARLPLLAHE